MALINNPFRLRDLDPFFLDRYNLTGPRYTSYPTAPVWRAIDGEGRVATHLDHLSENKTDQPLSIYMHLPFCRERCSFCACNVIVSSKNEAISEPYLAQLDREAELYARHVDTRRPVAQLHWGGGTPTYLTPDQLRRTHEMVARRFNLAHDAEQSIEIHVNWTSDEQVRLLADLGFNRLSIGVQDFNERTQSAIGRHQSVQRTRQIVDLARELGFKGINFDLIYGLPHQTPESFSATIDQVLEMAPDRLAVYNFAFLPDRLPNQRAIDPATLPTGAQKFRIFLEAHDHFAAEGYRYIGMDHFARPGDELARAFDEGTMQRNFMGFTTRAGADLLGMGVSAISSIDGLYAQNVKKLPAYAQALEAGQFPTDRAMALSPEDRLRRDVIGGLMCRDHVDKGEIEREHGIVFDDHFADELGRLAPMVADDLLAISPDALDLTFLGRLFVRNIAMVFDAYLKQPGEGGRPQFSRTL